MVSDLKDTLTPAEVGERLGLTDERIRQLIRLKKIDAVKVRGWRITEEAVVEFLKSRTIR